MRAAKEAPSLRCVRPFPAPAQWQVVQSVLARPAWDLTDTLLQTTFGSIWDGPQWYAVQRTDDTMTVEAGSYYAWCRTNRWLTQPAGQWPADLRDWINSYVWTNPPRVPDAVARIALTTGGWIRDRHGRYLAVQAPGRLDWTGSAGGGITPEDGWGPTVPEQAWRREVWEELGLSLAQTQPLGVVADPRTDCWCWLFAGAWDGDWDTHPWCQAVDGALEIHRVALLDGTTSPPPLSPVAAWAWAALEQAPS